MSTVAGDFSRSVSSKLVLCAMAANQVGGVDAPGDTHNGAVSLATKDHTENMFYTEKCSTWQRMTCFLGPQ